MALQRIVSLLSLLFFLSCITYSELSARETMEQPRKKHNEDAVELAGDYLTILVPLTAGAIAYFKDDNEGLKQVTYTGICSTIITHTFKTLVPAERPDDPNNTKSYVSGHTSLPMGASTFLQIRYGWRYGIPAHLISAFVGWSRVYSRRHHQSDVFRGTLVGVFSGWLFSTEYKDITVDLGADWSKKEFAWRLHFPWQ